LDLFAIIAEHADEVSQPVDHERVVRAFVMACAQHANQRRESGEVFIVHPASVAKICAGLRADTPTLCAGLLHETVADSLNFLDEIRRIFGEDVANLATAAASGPAEIASRDQLQPEDPRSTVSMAAESRTIQIMVADRLHNLRTIAGLPEEDQIAIARETLAIYAPLVHRLGIHAIKVELEDLSFATLDPLRFQEIKRLVGRKRDDRERDVFEALGHLSHALEGSGIRGEISGRAKHFYSIYSKMTNKGREFEQIHDLMGIRLIVESEDDCYAAIALIHSLWSPIPGRLKDYIAHPKMNGYRSLHTTVTTASESLLEIQVRTRAMHEHAASDHWQYKENSVRDQ